jgi:hypothetical protein
MTTPTPERVKPSQCPPRGNPTTRTPTAKTPTAKTDEATQIVRAKGEKRTCAITWRLGRRTKRQERAIGGRESRPGGWLAISEGQEKVRGYSDAPEARRIISSLPGKSSGRGKSLALSL